MFSEKLFINEFLLLQRLKQQISLQFYGYTEFIIKNLRYVIGDDFLPQLYDNSKIHKAIQIKILKINDIYYKFGH